jgi:hypothetical protein
MIQQVEHACNHGCTDSFACADALIYYDPKFDEYGIIVHDGGASYAAIDFCPFCGARLPESRRDLWFEKLQEMGIDPWDSEARPPEFETDEWYRQDE